MQHTPGPWAIAPSSNPKNGSAWRDIVSMGSEFSPAYIGEALEHDARLIAAAPAMLGALRDLVACTPETYDNRHELRAAIDAIAQATGAAE